MQLLYKLEKCGDNGQLKYEIIFDSKEAAEFWITEHPEQGFLHGVSVKEVVLNEKIDRTN